MILEDRGLGKRGGGNFFLLFLAVGKKLRISMFEGLLGNDERRRVNRKSVSLVRGNKTGDEVFGKTRV